MVPRVQLLGQGAAFAAIYLFWGGTFLAVRVAVQEVPPMTTVAVRCGLGAVLLGAWCWLRGTLARPTAPEWRSAALAGALLFLGCHALLAWAEQRVSSGQAALLLTSIPMWLVALDTLERRDVPSTRILSGLVLGTTGVGVLAGADGEWTGTAVDRAAILVGGLLWAIGSIVARNGARSGSVVQFTAMQLVAGAVVVGAGSLVAGEPRHWPVTVSGKTVIAFGFLVVCGTTLAFAAYSWLLRVASPVAVGTYAFVNPLVAVALAWLAGDEPVSRRTALAGGLVIAAVLLVRQRTRE